MVRKILEVKEVTRIEAEALLTKSLNKSIDEYTTEGFE